MTKNSRIVFISYASHIFDYYYLIMSSHENGYSLSLIAEEAITSSHSNGLLTPLRLSAQERLYNEDIFDSDGTLAQELAIQELTKQIHDYEVQGLGLAEIRSKLMVSTQSALDKPTTE